VGVGGESVARERGEEVGQAVGGGGVMSSDDVKSLSVGMGGY
jgi:hypothetical protein